MSQYSYWLIRYTCDHRSTSASLMSASYIPDTRMETDGHGRYYLYMRLDSLQWLDACVWPDSNENWTCGSWSGVSPMNCFGRSQHHLICKTQVFRYHRTSQPINQQVWNLKTHATCSSLFVVFNYKCAPDACPFCCDVNLAIRETHHPTPGNSAYPTCLPSQGSYWRYVCPIHSRYQTGNLWKILLVWDWIPYSGWMLVYGRISMKTELVEGVVCGVLLMNCFSRDRYHLICITQEIRYHKTGQPINQ